MIMKIKILTIVIGLCLVLSSCISTGYKGTGEPDNAMRYINNQIKDKVTELELIDTVHVEEWNYDSSISFDGTVFWPGKVRLIPAHDILYYRAFSPKLDSYVFLRFNDAKNTKQYILSSNCYLNKKDVKKTIDKTKEILADNNIQISKIVYTGYDEDTDVLDDVNKYTKDYYKKYLNDYYNDPKIKDHILYGIFINAAFRTYIIIDSTFNEFEPVAFDIGDIISESIYYFQMIIITNDNHSIVIHKGLKDAIIEVYDGNKKREPYIQPPIGSEYYQ